MVSREDKMKKKDKKVAIKEFSIDTSLNNSFLITDPSAQWSELLEDFYKMAAFKLVLCLSVLHMVYGKGEDH